MSSGKFPCLMMILAAVAGCSSLPAAIESEVVRSTLYDEVPCPSLKAQRAALVAQYGDPAAQPDKRQPGEPVTPTGLSVVTPDFRSATDKERGVAWGRIEAMTSSLERRQCGA